MSIPPTENPPTSPDPTDSPEPEIPTGDQVSRLEGQLRTSRILNLVLVVVSVVLGVALYLTSTGATSGAGAEGATGSGGGPGTSPAGQSGTQSGVDTPDTADPAAPGAPAPGAPQQGTGGESTGPGEGATPSGDQPYVRREEGDPLAIGALDAPVVLSEWTDLRCPFCAVFANQTLPTLIQEYVDTGKVRIEFHDVVFFGDQSRDAAVAARAAGEQGLYVEYLETLYAAAPPNGHPDLPRAALIDFARTTGVPDMDAFTRALDDPDLGQKVDRSTAVAQSLGVNSVPFFVIDGKALAGAQGIDTFRQFIDQALAEAGR